MDGTFSTGLPSTFDLPVLALTHMNFAKVIQLHTKRVYRLRYLVPPLTFHAVIIGISNGIFFSSPQEMHTLGEMTPYTLVYFGPWPHAFTVD